MTPAWRLWGSYSYLHMHSDSLAPGLSSPIPSNDPTQSPARQFQLHSNLELPRRWELDAALYHVARLSYTGSSVYGIVFPGAPAYTRVDLRLGWRPTDRLELSLIGQNLLQSRHLEFAPFLYRSPSEVPRSVFVQATAGF